jgi:hypothetical protein
MRGRRSKDLPGSADAGTNLGKGFPIGCGIVLGAVCSGCGGRVWYLVRRSISFPVMGPLTDLFDDESCVEMAWEPAMG